jgi:DNA-binding NtrC family response regulator
VPKPRVLILACDLVIAALLGMLAELENLEPVFAEPGERAEDAVARHRTPLVLILDVDLDVALSDLFFARAAKANASVVLFATPRSQRDVAAEASRRGVPWFAVPCDRSALIRAIEHALAISR